MILNPNNDPTQYAKELQETGSVTIDNFLTEESANFLYRYFSQEMDDTEWWSASYPTGFAKDADTRNLPENREKILEEKQRAINAYVRGDFAYHFYRTFDNHVTECECTECKFRAWLLSPEMIKFFHEVSGETYTSYNATFASKYSDGCFLAPHTDQWRGDIGFVLQLTKNWWPQWGGLLHFLDETTKMNSFNDTILKVAHKQPKVVAETQVPRFNSLTLFHLPEQSGRWHYVSHVNPGVKQSRIAYSGWFKK